MTAPLAWVLGSLYGALGAGILAWLLLRERWR
jgi:hypothetical protein